MVENYVLIIREMINIEPQVRVSLEEVIGRLTKTLTRSMSVDSDPTKFNQELRYRSEINQSEEYLSHIVTIQEVEDCKIPSKAQFESQENDSKAGNGQGNIHSPQHRETENITDQARNVEKMVEVKPKSIFLWETQSYIIRNKNLYILKLCSVKN